MIPETNKSQGWKNILLIIIPYAIVLGIFHFLSTLILEIELEIFKNATIQRFIKILFFTTGNVTVIWLFRRYVEKLSFSSLGFPRTFFKKDIFLGLITAFLIMSLSFVCLLLSGQIEVLSVRFDLLEIILNFGIFIFVALAEEILFRGFILGNLMASFNKYIALFISAFLFSLMHASNPHLNLMGIAGLFVSGLLYGIPYIYTKSLWFPIAIHFSWNFFQGTIFGFNVSGMNNYSLITTKFNSGNVWNGGDFGFEGSILSILFQLLSLAIVFKIYKRRETRRAFIDETTSGVNITRGSLINQKYTSYFSKTFEGK